MTISTAPGFDRGFETFRYLYREPARRIVSAGVELVKELSRKQDPFFLYLHFLDPHDPYSPPDGYAEMFPGRLTRADFRYRDRIRGPMRRYDGEIRYLDDELGRTGAEAATRNLGKARERDERDVGREQPIGASRDEPARFAARAAAERVIAQIPLECKRHAGRDEVASAARRLAHDGGAVPELAVAVGRVRP